MKTITVRLPFPPSINGYWRSINRGKYVSQIISEDGRRFREHVKTIFQATPVKVRFDGPVEVEIILRRGDRVGYDCDNFAKAILDGLTHANVWNDDRQVDALLIRRGPVVPKDGHALVTIREIEGVA